jgi:hypothetical protein
MAAGAATAPGLTAAQAAVAGVQAAHDLADRAVDAGTNPGGPESTGTTSSATNLAGNESGGNESGAGERP